MKIFKYICFVVMLSQAALQAQAQVNKEVEVTKAYVPTIEMAQKPQLKAEIADTTYINPEIDYDITPLAINTQLQTMPIKPATVTYWEYNKPAVGQLKIGAGAPFNTLLQGYVSSHNASVGYVMARVDHRGFYSKITNVYNDAIDATQVLNDVQLCGGLYLAGRTLSADLSYSNDIYNRYAFKQVVSPLVGYQRLGASLRFGDDFVDLSRTNFSVQGGYKHFFDRDMNIDNDVEFGVSLGRDFKLGRALLDASYSGVNSSGMYANNRFVLDGYVNRDLSDWQLLIGAKYIFDDSKLSGEWRPNHYIIPQIVVRNVSNVGISPFAKIGGGVSQNSFANLVEKNPYIGAELYGESMVEYNFVAGIMGRLASSTLAYRADVAYTTTLNTPLWGLIINCDDMAGESVYNSYFDMALSSLNTTSVNIALDYKPLTDLSVALDAHYYAYSQPSADKYVASLPNFDLSLGVDYSVRGVNFGVEGKVIGERTFSVEKFTPSSVLGESVEEKLPVAVDVNAYVNWQANDKLSIFVEGLNLCNRDLYPWPCYRGFGVQFTAGVKFNF